MPSSTPHTRSSSRCTTLPEPDPLPETHGRGLKSRPFCFGGPGDSPHYPLVNRFAIKGLGGCAQENVGRISVTIGKRFLIAGVIAIVALGIVSALGIWGVLEAARGTT